MATTADFTLDFGEAAVCIIQAYEAAMDSLQGSIFASGRRELETRRCAAMRLEWRTVVSLQSANSAARAVAKELRR